MTFCIEKLKRLPAEVGDPMNADLIEIQEAFAVRERWREEHTEKAAREKPSKSIGRRPRKR